MISHFYYYEFVAQCETTNPKSNNALSDEGVVVCKESDDDLLSHG